MIETELSLEGIDLTGVPGCEIRLAPDWETFCGQPSVARIRHWCMDCGREAVMFVCEECLTDLSQEKVVCKRCEGGHLVWKLT